MSTNKLVIYELPLNEHIRVCLRLERLFHQVRHHLTQSAIWDAQAALFAILDIIDVVDRPDLKGKITNALHMYATALAKHSSSPNVDKAKLEMVLSQLDKLIDILHHAHGKLGQSLRGNEFLQSVRQYIIPGGICEFSVPAFSLWLQQTAEERQADLIGWFSEFEMLREVVGTLMQLTRDSSTPMKKIATNGFYQETLASEILYQMIRVAIPEEENAYPEISVGRHRLSSYFFKLDVKGKSQQIDYDLTFELTACRV
jgi:cell division protein ZapD